MTDFDREAVPEIEITEHLTLVDTHSHLADRRLLPQIESVLARARLAGVVQVIAVATTANDSQVVVDLARRHRGVFATVGIHPNDGADAALDDWKTVERLALSSRVVALGETGLDRHWDRTPFPVQQEYFERHLNAAHALDLPVVIHCRESACDILLQLQNLNRPVKGVLHSFTGDWDLARQFLDLGLYLSFAGMVTFENKSLDPLREAASQVPIDRVLVETDSPYLTPHPFRGKTNEPARVSLVASRLAELRNLDPAIFSSHASANAQRLFNLPADDLLTV